MDITNSPEDAVFAVDTLDSVQVGLACVLQDDVVSTLDLLRILSMPVAVSVLEIAALGGWLPLVRPRSQALMDQGFFKEDLLVLSHGPSTVNHDEVDRDDFLNDYAELLSHQQQV